MLVAIAPYSYLEHLPASYSSLLQVHHMSLTSIVAQSEVYANYIFQAVRKALFTSMIR